MGNNANRVCNSPFGRSVRLENGCVTSHSRLQYCLLHINVVEPVLCNIAKMSDEFMLKEAQQGRTKPVMDEIKKGAKINFADTYGRTAIFYAAQGNHIDLVKQLIAAGADVNATADEGTALHIAAKKGFLDIVKLLVDAKADVNAHGDVGKSPLHKAVGESRTEVVQYLVSKGAKVDSKTVTDVEPLHLACAEGATDLALFLLSKGANVNCRNANLKTPLHIAAEKNNLALVKKLLMAGADKNLENIWGRKAAVCGNNYIEKLINDHQPGQIYEDPVGDDSDDEE